ncbi:hypothetical protein [Burkholderia multivorans]|uniref:hypothetical protein n=1 Tax=Burkholderia multivorans TaxID=87883 RepID=UPI0020B2D231|nr:hypothetical protein [Burkholderia multivorans]
MPLCVATFLQSSERSHARIIVPSIALRDRTIAIAPPHRRAAAVSLVLVPNGHALCDLLAPANPADDYFPEPGVAPRANRSRGRSASQAGFLNERTT